MPVVVYSMVCYNKYAVVGKIWYEKWRGIQRALQGCEDNLL